MSIRARVLALLAYLEFRVRASRYLFDKPRLKYQPLPWLGVRSAGRAQGTLTRMSAIDDFLREKGIADGIAVDYGCNVGFFSASLAEKGFFVFGVESDPRSVAIARLAAQAAAPGRFCGVQMSVTEQTVSYMPAGDVTLCLSIWHHWVRAYGLDEASAILRQIFDKTGRVLFFDTGELEMPPHYNLPAFEPDPRNWLADYLAGTLGGDVVWLGQHRAFAPGMREGDQVVERNLFAVLRKGGASS